jgi:magnesium transporter
VIRPRVKKEGAMDAANLARKLERVHDADVADALNAIDPPAAARVLAALPFDLAVRALNQPELDHRAKLFEHLPTEKAVALIGAMSADQRADVFRDLPPGVAARLSAAVDASTQESLRSLLSYPPTTAGGIMTTEHVEAPGTWTVERTLAQIRSDAQPHRPVYAVYVLDPVDRRLVHAVTLRELVLADPTRTLLEVGDRRPPVTVDVWTDREEAARLIAKYDLLAVPVIDEGGHVLGIVTVDDVIDAMVKEQTEDVHKLGGVQELDEPYTKIAFGTMIRKRGGWLCALFLSEMLTATAMQHFAGELSRAIVLTLFIPLIMSSGGNSGSQATSLIIRALALREVRLRDWWWIALREIPAGAALGAVLGAIGIARIVSWQKFGFYDYGPHWFLVALTVGLALVGVVTFGSLVGSMLPFILRRLGFDPASASAPFVATLVDVTGLVIYFTVAYAVLRGTLL